MVKSGVLQNRPNTIILLIILHDILFNTTAVFVAGENSRSGYFVTRENKRLPGHVIKRFGSPSLMSCSQSCLRSSWCTSTNFKESSKQHDKGTCELNKHENAPINEDTELVDQPGVTFSTFLKGCLMTGCLNGGSCLFDNEKETFSCLCKLPWSGENCGIKIAKNCVDIYKAGLRRDGIYTIKPDNDDAFKVFCDQTTAGGGWTVIQKRLDGSVDFYLGWDDYKRGFGNLSGEFWLGLDKIHRLTKEGSRLRVDLEDFNGTTAYAEYSLFGVADEGSNYSLTLGTYNGTAGDSLSYHRGMPFSTKDRDNDKHSGQNCATVYKGAWWYKFCHYSNLNGRYLKGNHSSYADGVNWFHWKGYRYSVKRAEMKIKPVYDMN